MSRMKTTGLGESLVSHGQPHFIQCLEDICRGEGRAGGGWARIISMPKISSFKQLYDYAGGINFIFSDSHTLVWGGGGVEGCLSLDSHVHYYYYYHAY